MSELMVEAFEALRTRGLNVEEEELKRRIICDGGPICKLFCRAKGWVFMSLVELGLSLRSIINKEGCLYIDEASWEQERQHLAWWLWGELNNGGGE